MTFWTFLKANKGDRERRLLLGVMGWSLTDLLLHEEEEIPEETEARLNAGLSRLRAGEPLQYVLQKAPFYGREFRVDERVLIPRFDSEIALNCALEALPESRDAEILDLCTGSGCLGLTLALERPEARVTLSDLSDGALEVAKENAEALGARVTLIKSDLFDAIDGCFDLVISNPPYIPSAVIETLDTEVRDHEPRLALDGGEDGLKLYRRIAREAPRHLKNGGILVLEIGFDEGAAVQALLLENGFTKVRVEKDLSGLDRVVKACWNNSNV